MTFYTISPINPKEQNLIGPKISELFAKGLKSGKRIKISTSIFFKSEMKKIGITILNDSEVPYEIVEIGREQQDCSKSLIDAIEKECGWKLQPVYAEIDLNKMNTYISKINNVIILNEEIIRKNTDKNEIYCKFEMYLEQIISGCPNNDYLIITDPYFFCTHDEMIDIVISVIEKAEICKLKLYTDLTHHNQKTTIEGKLTNAGIHYVLNDTKDIHDRFWIYGENGFVLGTSLNGIAKKITRIDLLDSNEVKIIKDELKKMGDGK